MGNISLPKIDTKQGLDATISLAVLSAATYYLGYRRISYLTGSCGVALAALTYHSYAQNKQPSKKVDNPPPPPQIDFTKLPAYCKDPKYPNAAYEYVEQNLLSKPLVNRASNDILNCLLETYRLLTNGQKATYRQEPTFFIYGHLFSGGFGQFIVADKYDILTSDEKTHFQSAMEKFEAQKGNPRNPSQFHDCFVEAYPTLTPQELSALKKLMHIPTDAKDIQIEMQQLIENLQKQLSAEEHDVIHVAGEFFYEMYRIFPFPHANLGEPCAFLFTNVILMQHQKPPLGSDSHDALLKNALTKDKETVITALRRDVIATEENIKHKVLTI